MYYCKYIKTYFLLVICIAKNFIWTTLKMIFSMLDFCTPSDSRFSNSCISDLFIQLSCDVYITINKKRPIFILNCVCTSNHHYKCWQKHKYIYIWVNWPLTQYSLTSYNRGFLFLHESLVFIFFANFTIYAWNPMEAQFEPNTKNSVSKQQKG